MVYMDTLSLVDYTVNYTGKCIYIQKKDLPALVMLNKKDTRRIQQQLIRVFNELEQYNFFGCQQEFHTSLSVTPNQYNKYVEICEYYIRRYITQWRF